MASNEIGSIVSMISNGSGRSEGSTVTRDKAMTNPGGDNQASPKAEDFMQCVKDELKWLIKCRRHAQYKDDINIDLSPRQPDAPSATDLEMQNERRKRNNHAARKYRHKLKEVQDRIFKEHSIQARTNKRLVKIVKQLHADRTSLTKLLKAHMATCTNTTLSERTEKMTAYMEGFGGEDAVTYQLSNEDKTISECMGHRNQLDEFDMEPETFDQCDSFYEENSWAFWGAKRRTSSSDLSADTDPGNVQVLSEMSTTSIPTLIDTMLPQGMGVFSQSLSSQSDATHYSFSQESPQFVTSNCSPFQLPSWQHSTDLDYSPATQSPALQNMTTNFPPGVVSGVHHSSPPATKVQSPTTPIVTFIDPLVVMSSTQTQLNPTITIAADPSAVKYTIL